MKTQSIIDSMTASHNASRMKAVAYHVSNQRPGPVRARLVGQRIQGGSAWQALQQNGALYGQRQLKA